MIPIIHAKNKALFLPFTIFLLNSLAKYIAPPDLFHRPNIPPKHHRYINNIRAYDSEPRAGVKNTFITFKLDIFFVSKASTILPVTIPQNKDNKTCLVKKDKAIATIAGRIDINDEFSIFFPLLFYDKFKVCKKKLYMYAISL